MFRKRLLEKSGDASVTTTPLIPYGLVEDWLSSSRIVEVMGVNPYEVYKNILDVIPEWKRYTGDEVKTVKREPDCPICHQGYIVLDTTEANTVCNCCGAVGRQKLNIEREYTKPVEDTICKDNTIPGVSKWVVGMVHGKSEKNYGSIFEHWNSYTHLPLHDLRLVTWLMTHIQWSGYDNEETRICALLLAPRVEILDEHEFRANISKAQTLTESKKKYSAIDPTPHPEKGRHVCANCGISCFGARDARFHCKWSQNISKAKLPRQF